MGELIGFVPDGAPVPVDPPRPEQQAHLIDLFTTVHPAREWVVVMDWEGLPALLPRGAELASGVREELAVTQAATAGAVRRLDVDELHLFWVEALELRPDMPGANDPVVLRGSLLGPYLREGQPPARTRGALHTTRADVLDGFARSGSLALTCAARGEGTRRWFHAALACATEEEVRAGRGLVLAYPLDRPSAERRGNEARLTALCHELVRAARDDAERTYLPDDAALPVPDLQVHRAKLALAGAVIEGSAVVVPPAAEAPWYERAWRALFPRRVPLPEEGTPEDFLGFARRAVEGLTGWPTPRVVALWERILQLEVAWTSGREQGLRPARAADGEYSLEDGTISPVRQRGHQYLYFDVEDVFAGQAAGGEVLVEVEYLDACAGAAIGLEFSGAGDPYRPAPGLLQHTGSGRWRTGTLRFAGARLRGNQNGGADLRLHAPTAAALQVRRVTVRALAVGARPPIGHLESVSPHGRVVGWAYDPDGPARPVTVDVLVDAPTEVAGGTRLRTRAECPRPDVNVDRSIPGDHGFVVQLPIAQLGRGRHAVYAYALDLDGRRNALLPPSPRTFEVSTEP